MAARSWIGSPVRLAALFVVVAGVPLAGLGWLGHRVLQQQADLDSERLQTQLANSATLLAREIDRALSQWESLALAVLDSPPAAVTIPPGISVVVLDAQGLVRAEGLRLPYYPLRPRRATDYRDALRKAEAAEFQHKDFTIAAALYAGLADSRDRQLAAAAMLGAARVLQRLGRQREALVFFDRLAGLVDVNVGGAPAEVVAHRMRLGLFEESGDRNGASRERAWLTAALATGRWPIDRATYDEYVATLGLSPTPAPEAVAIADVISDRWHDWFQTSTGRAEETWQPRPLVSAWRRRGSQVAIVIGRSDQLLSALDPLAKELSVRAQVLDSEGRPVWGSAAGSAAHASRVLRGDVGLTWSLTAAAEPQASVTWLSRQQLFGIGFGLLAFVVVGAAYTVFRFVSKELAVARLQTDFVSAVSHEFRTPLTALRHVSDLLEDGTVGPQDLPEFYRAIGKESRRLQGLVENLLDFGKLEGGRHVYDFDDLDVVALTRDAVQDVAGHAALNGHQVRLATPEAHLSIRADRHAVFLALRNIIENAVKYSPGANAIDVRVQSDAGTVAIAVQDYGVGVPASEQRDVFRKFVRGSAARALMIKGTGIGLAMADRIVRDHGGSITLESAPGHGSTFTVSLPRSHA